MNLYRKMIEELPDFSEAKFTAVVSDLHLCDEEPLNSKFPLWKKYKTRQFFFDDVFRDFLQSIVHRAGGERVELVLNGDIFDFDSVNHLPDEPPYRITWIEGQRGLHPQAEKSIYKIQRILEHHRDWVLALNWFINAGNRVIFVIGNHDLELHFPSVQDVVIQALGLNPKDQSSVRFVEWFYISNADTLIEHGNQYDPYCLAQDPVNPFILRLNRVEIRIPFGNLATRYMINGMGFFNPHVDTNFIMSAKEYVHFFFKYVVRAQPMLLWTWLWGATVTLSQSFWDRLIPSIIEPLTVEDKVELIAAKANATSRMVRELRELFATPAASTPTILMRELWLDRAFLILIAFFVIFQIVLSIKTVYSLSFFWMFIPLSLFLPFFLFYSRSITSEVIQYKEPSERILSMASAITKANRIVYGHTHVVRHEIVGNVEHLNSGTWSPAFLDVECEQPIDQKTFVWIYPGSKGLKREARVYQFKDGKPHEVFGTAGRHRY